MADFSISITNQIQSFGPAPSTKWGSAAPGMSWGVDKWGEGSATHLLAVEKYLSETQAVDQSISNQVDFNLSLSNSMSAAFEMSSESVQDPSGYFRVFTKPTIDPETQVITTYTAVAAGTQTYSSVVATSTVWS